MAVVDFELVAAFVRKLRPLEFGGDGIVEAQFGHLIGELEEEQVSDLLHVVAVTDPGVLKDVGVVPDFGDNVGGGVGAHNLGEKRGLLVAKSA